MDQAEVHALTDLIGAACVVLLLCLSHQPDVITIGFRSLDELRKLYGPSMHERAYFGQAPSV